MGKSIKRLRQYYFAREDFINEFRRVFTNIEILNIISYCEDLQITDRFFLLYENGEYYIIHRYSGIIINWYKHLGRTNTCNMEGFTRKDLHNFLILLKKDLKFKDRAKKDDL